MKTTRMIRSIFLVIVMISSAFHGIQAQDNEAEPEAMKEKGPYQVRGGFGYFTPGIQMYSMADFNEYFAPKAFAPVNDNGVTLGGGGNIIIKNLVLGGEGHSIVTKRASSSLKDVQLESGWGMFQVGYIVLARKKFMLFPKLGIGGFNHEMTIKDQISTSTMDTVVAGDFSGTMVDRRGMLGSAELCFEYIPTVQEKSASGLVFGLTVGYQMALTDKGWEAYETPLTGGPEVDLSGLYIRLHVGLGGWSLRSKK